MYRENVKACLDGYENRRRKMLEREANFEPNRRNPLDLWMHRLHPLYLNRKIVEGKAALLAMAEWFDHPNDDLKLGADFPQGGPDFPALKLCRAWYLFRESLIFDSELVGKIRQFFLHHDFASIYQSENHVLVFHTARYLMAQVYRKELFHAYGKTGEELIPLEVEWLTRYLRYRSQCGWGEFDSSIYLCFIWECLCGLYDYAEDVNLKETAGKMMDLLLADMAADSLNGMYGGAHGRIYAPQALDHADEGTRGLQYLYFGLFEPLEGTGHGFLIDALVCSYRPHPVVVDIALNRAAAYENFERKHLHNLADVLPLEPLDGSLRKYTYWTPNFVMGAVQYQDAYPMDGRRVCDCASSPMVTLHGKVEAEQSCAHEYAHHQQHQWDLSFAARSDARLFTHHPGDSATHGYWTGDRLCGCGHFFQNRTALVALYDIPGDQSLQWIHAYVPKAAFDEVVERDGVIFTRSGKSGAALILLPRYRWTTEGEWKDREVISEGLRHAVVCEAGLLEDFGGFTAFQDEVFSNRIQYDPEVMTLTYHSKRAGVLGIDAQGKRELNGHPANLEYPTYDSPYLKSAWKSGGIELFGSDQNRLKFDF